MQKMTIYPIFSTVLQDLETAHLLGSYCILSSTIERAP